MLKNKVLITKLQESINSVLPIGIIVCILAFLAAPVATDAMLSFLVGSVLLIIGLSIFMYGSDNSMVVIGQQLGSTLTKSRNIAIILAVSFLIGVIITMAEPDLQVLSGNVSHIDSFVLIFTVSVGVGIFLVLCMLRILFGISLRWMLIIFYGIILVLAFLSDPDYISVAFDSGGVTTGPMTAPFIIAMGVGVSAIRSDQNAEDDSFGLVALCSIGPVLAVLLLGLIKGPDSTELNRPVFFVQQTLEAALAGTVCLSLIFAMYRLPAQTPSALKAGFFAGLLVFLVIYSGIPQMFNLSETAVSVH